MAGLSSRSSFHTQILLRQRPNLAESLLISFILCVHYLVKGVLLRVRVEPGARLKLRQDIRYLIGDNEGTDTSGFAKFEARPVTLVAQFLHMLFAAPHSPVLVRRRGAVLHASMQGLNDPGIGFRLALPPPLRAVAPQRQPHRNKRRADANDHRRQDVREES